MPTIPDLFTLVVRAVDRHYSYEIGGPPTWDQLDLAYEIEIPTVPTGNVWTDVTVSQTHVLLNI